MKTGKKISKVILEGGPEDEKEKKNKKKKDGLKKKQVTYPVPGSVKGDMVVAPSKVILEGDKKKKKKGKGSSGKMKWQRIKKSDQPLSDWDKKKAEEKAQRKIEREGKKSFRGGKLKLFFRKLKGKMTNPELKDQKCKPSGGTKNCPKSYLGGKN